MGTTSETHRVLVIDDEADIADSLTDILILHGYDAVAFHGGLSAIESIRNHCPSIVVSDVVMPKLNGVDTVAAIHEFCPDVRILLLSGQALTTDILEKLVHRDTDLRSFLNQFTPTCCSKRFPC
jgi:DNA-binding NtrC family response regulator